MGDDLRHHTTVNKHGRVSPRLPRSVSRSETLRVGVHTAVGGISSAAILRTAGRRRLSEMQRRPYFSGHQEGNCASADGPYETPAPSWCINVENRALVSGRDVRGNGVRTMDDAQDVSPALQRSSGTQ